MVGAQIGGAEIDIEQVGAAGKMQGTGLRGEPLALFEDIGDVFAGEGLGVESVFDGASQVVLAVDVGEGNDFVDVDAGAQAAGAQLPVVGFGAGTQRVESQEPFGVAGAAALCEQFSNVVGVFEVAVTLVGVTCVELGEIARTAP